MQETKTYRIRYYRETSSAGKDLYIFLESEGTLLPLFSDVKELKEATDIFTEGLPLCSDFRDLPETGVLYLPKQWASEMPENIITLYARKEGLYNFPASESFFSLVEGYLTYENVWVAYTEAEAQVSRQAEDLAQRLRFIYANYPELKQLYYKKNGRVEVISLLSLFARQSEEVQEQIKGIFRFYSSTMRRATLLAKTRRALELCSLEGGVSFTTQEEQVGFFLDCSQKRLDQIDPLITDENMDAMRNSIAYKKVTDRLQAEGFGFSHTQLFNILQAAGYFATTAVEPLYNLSDMGAGKTLMTVGALALLDHAAVSAYLEQRKDFEEGIEIESVYLPAKHLIAPTLSMKSSWLATFQIFYEVEQQDDYTYTLTLKDADHPVTGRLHLAPFVVRGNLLTVENTLPAESETAYLIIDEIHQLVTKNLPRTKFFPPKTNPREAYRTFVLSGTLSSLSVGQWFHLCRFMGIPLTDSSVSTLIENNDDARNQYRKQLRQVPGGIRERQHATLAKDTYTAQAFAPETEKKMSSVEEHFFLTYGAKLVTPYQKEGTLADVLDGRLGIYVNPAVRDIPNMQLFYEIVGQSAITATSAQISQELFGDAQKEHASQILKLPSPLSADDIRLLKQLARIAKDHKLYGSPKIGTAIYNAILNLNDGLSTKNLYDLLERFARNNTRFFTYLAGLPVNVLETLPKSGLIANPNLKETAKFQALQKLLAQETDETHLIVVNDFDAMQALSKALKLSAVTKAQYQKPMEYQETLNALFEKQSVVVVCQDMIKSSLDLIQANRLIQYQLNTEISDIIQTQNRINRIGQTRETKSYYIASDVLQETLISLFLESYRNIRVAHKGIVELFVDLTSRIQVVGDFIGRAVEALDDTAETDVEMESDIEETTEGTSVEETPEEAIEEMTEETTEETTEEMVEVLDETFTSDIYVEPLEGITLPEEATSLLLYPGGAESLLVGPGADGSAVVLSKVACPVVEPIMVQYKPETKQITLPDIA